MRLPNLGIWQGLGIPRESDLGGKQDLITRLPQDWGKQRLQSYRAQTKPCVYQIQRKGAVTPQETEPKLPANVGGSLEEAEVSRGSLQCQWHWKVPLGINPLGVHIKPYHRAYKTQGWVTSSQKASKEGAQPFPSADNWTKALLNKALPTRARPTFSQHQSFPSGSLQKPLSLFHQRAERRSKKNHSSPATKTKTTLQELSLLTFMHWRRKWQPTPVFLPGESQGWGSLLGCRL